jgi:hypothetical protein
VTIRLKVTSAKTNCKIRLTDRPKIRMLLLMFPRLLAAFISATVTLGVCLPQVVAAPVPGTVFELDGTDTGLTGIIAIASGFTGHVLLRSNGTVQSIGIPNQPANLNNVIAVSVGYNFGLALRSDHTVVGWGGQPPGGGAVPPGLTGIAAISAGYDNAIGLRNDGTVLTWGFNYQGTNTPPVGLNGVTAIAAGLGFNLALKSDGTIVGWGHGTIIGQVVPPGLTNIVGISASIRRNQFAAVRGDGTVVGWGDNYDGAPTIPGITDAVAVAAQNGGGVVLRSNGTLTGWEVSLFGVIRSVSYPAVLNNIVAISSDLALKVGPGVPATGNALNISTRLRVETGDNVLIGGFIVSGTHPKSVIVRALGPSLGNFGLSGALSDPVLEIRNSSGGLVASNDDWRTDQQAQITGTGLAPSDILESAIVVTLPANNSAYTAIVRGYEDATGIGVVEAYDLDGAIDSQLANISTRGFIQTGNNVLIGGFILGSGANNTRVAVRGIGPSLSQLGLSPVLADPTLELHDSNGATLVSNDNWQDDSVTAAQLTALGLAPSNPAESGIIQSLPPGAFTAILAGKNGGTGIGLVEIYNMH